MTKLFIGGLPYTINNKSLAELFVPYGKVISASVITDKFNNQSKGFGFVEMTGDNVANEVIQKLDGSILEGHKLRVSIAKPREERSFSNGQLSDRRDDYRNYFRRGKR